MNEANPLELLHMTRDIVVAIIQSGPSGENLADVIGNTYAALSKCSEINIDRDELPAGPVPAYDPAKSVKPGYLVSLIDGKRYKMLRRHIGLHGFTPESYRAAFGLREDYPMVAKDYAEKRRQLAKDIGLGTFPKKRG